MKLGDMESHPAADAFPIMQGADFDDLVQDIKANGQHLPIDLHNGVILDGRNRYLACLKAKVEPVFREYTGDPVAYVISLNFRRRELTRDQRSLAARGLGAYAAKITKGRRKHESQIMLPHVPEATAEQVDRLIEDGCDELRAAVDRGDISLSVAAEIAAHEPEQQRQAVDAVTKALEESEKPEKPERTSRREAAMSTVAIDLTPVDVAALKALLFVAAKSAHAEVRAGGTLLARMAPVLR